MISPFLCLLGLYLLDRTQVRILVVLIVLFSLKKLFCRLDYPGVGPEHSFLKDLGRAEYHSITDDEALEGRTAVTL